MLRKLGSYPRQNGVAVALRELGRIERTLFTLDWLPDSPRNRLSRAARRARRVTPCPGQPGRAPQPNRSGLEAPPRRVAEPLSAEDMAKRAGMSVSAFHHHFKLVTGSSPLQYLKRIRLDQARRLMAHDGYNASTAARAVGYESPSQFSREFKRLFGVTPLGEAENTRARLVAG